MPRRGATVATPDVRVIEVVVGVVLSVRVVVVAQEGSLDGLLGAG